MPGWQRIWFDERDKVVWLPAGVEIDLGATAKALAADLAAVAALESAGGGGVLVSLGGDIAVAGQAPGGGWHIQIKEDSGVMPGDGAETISISSGAVATSSTTVRTWRRGEVVHHHIIDPRTGRSADGEWRTVSVVAGNCVDANIASTAAIVIGQPALAWLDVAGLPARLVTRRGAVRRVAGWPPAQPSETER